MGKVAQANMLRFIKNNTGLIKAFKGSDLFLPTMIAIGYAESGFGGKGESDAAKYRNNYFGINNGNRKFPSAQAAFEYQNSLFYKQPYTSFGVTEAKDPYDQARRIANSGYYLMDNDGSLGNDKKLKSRLAGANWSKSKQRWVRPDGSVIKFTKQESYDRYYNTIKMYIDDALNALPVSKITDDNYSQIVASL